MTLRITDHGEDRTLTLDQLIAHVGSGRPAARTTVTATYQTPSVSPTVYFTALLSDAVTVLVSRRTSGVVLVGDHYTYPVPVTGVTDVIVFWDEGDPDDYVDEWIVVDT